MNGFIEPEAYKEMIERESVEIRRKIEQRYQPLFENVQNKQELKQLKKQMEEEILTETKNKLGNVQKPDPYNLY